MYRRLLMKKIIYILGLALMLTGCSSSFISTEEEEELLVTKELEETIDSSERGMYIDDEFKSVILEINSLREKYKDSPEEGEVIYDHSDGYGYEDKFLYIDMYDPSNASFTIDNSSFNNIKYFNDLVEILDKSIAEGLKENIEEMNDKEIEEGKLLLRKIGKVALYAENGGGYTEDDKNLISIKINFADLKNEYYSELFNKVSEDKYLVDNMTVTDRSDMMDFSNINNSYYDLENDYLSIRYNIYLKDSDIKKVNILMQGKKGLELEEDDVDVFVNLMDTLDLKEEEKDLLLSDYKDIFLTKPSKRKKSFENYNLLINSSKGNSYSDNDRKLVYFSLERI